MSSWGRHLLIFFSPSEQCGQISHLCTRALFPVCGGSTVTSIFKAFIGGLGAPSTCSTQELISRRWFYADFSPQSRSFFGSVSSRLKFFTHRLRGSSSPSLGFPVLCPDPGISFSLCLWPKCQVSVQV